MTSPPPAPVFLAAGGTGGHLFPAEALARELLARGRVVHIITDSRGKAFGDSLPEIPVHRVAAATLTGGSLARLRAGAALLRGTAQAVCLLRAHRPGAVVSFGGYPSFPGALAAILTRTPLIIHDQNAVLGRANRIMARFARVIAKSFERVRGLPANRPAVLTGNPVRPGIATLRDHPYPAPEPGGALNLLVTGGSQGARVFSTVVPEALALLDPALRARLSISQQVRTEDMPTALALYARLDMGDRVNLRNFFTDMPEQIAHAHLFIGRAGGSTVAELAAVGRPAIYIPLPIAILDEQTDNAQAIEQAGGAFILQQPDFTPAALAALLTRLLTDPQALTAAAKAAHGCGRTDAARRLADLVLQTVEKRP